MMKRLCGESVFVLHSCLIFVILRLTSGFDRVFQVGESGAGGHVCCIYPHHEVSVYIHTLAKLNQVQNIVIYVQKYTLN